MVTLQESFHEHFMFSHQSSAMQYHTEVWGKMKNQ